MKPLKRWQKIFLILAGIWVAGVVLTAPLIVRGVREWRAVEQKFDDFSQALVEERYEDAYEYCGTGFRSTTPYEVFIEHQEILAKRHGELKAIHGKGTTLSIKESEADWAAVIKADFEFEKATRRVILEWHHEGGRWVVFGFKEMER